MTVSEEIRVLARDGLSVAEIARRLGIRYQHAYNLLKANGLLSTARSRVAPDTNAPTRPLAARKPPLMVEDLREADSSLLVAGFNRTRAIRLLIGRSQTL